MLSLAMFVALVILSRLKFEMILVTVNFLDLMIIDTDNISYVFNFMPDLLRKVSLVMLAGVPIAVLFWWIDRFRLRRWIAAAGLVACLAGASAISLAAPQ